MRRLVYVISSFNQFARCGLIGLVVLGLGGCSSANLPWNNASQDTGSRRSAAASRSTGKAVIVVGAFANPPASPVGWSDIGTGMSDALGQKLLERKDLIVQSDPQLASEVHRAVAAGGSQLAANLKAIHKRNPHARFVMTGRVTEFKHDVLRPDDITKWSASRHRHQAVAALNLEMVDLLERRVVVSDRIEAHAWASDVPTDQTYRGVSFGSYRFWDTPLGLASRDVVNQVAARVDRIAPVQHEQPIRIVDRITDRRVRLALDSASKVATGDVLYVCEYDASGTNLKPVVDPVTASPLQAKIESRGMYPSAWLLGQPPASVNLRHAVLSANLPPVTTTSVQGKTANFGLR